MSDVFGFQGVRSALRDNPERARCLYVQKTRRDARINELIGMARDQGIRYQVVEPAWIRKRVGDAAHQGVLLVCRDMKVHNLGELKERLAASTSPPLLLVLDEVSDPRNLGACLRTANAAGVDAVIVPKRNSAPLSGVTLKTAQGGAEHLYIVEVTNLARAMRELADDGIWFVGTGDRAKVDYLEVDYSGPTAIVMGNEEKGLRRLTSEHCDQLVSIPMLGTVESLNVSVATGVLLYEVYRQRSEPGDMKRA